MAKGKNRNVSCIYCGRHDGPRSREHVLQDAFGASAILLVEVCEDCNNAFSGVDKYFIDAVLRWHIQQHSPGLLGVGNVHQRDDPALAVRIAHDGSGYTLPQLVISRRGVWSFHGPSESIFDRMMDELKTPGEVILSSRILSDADMPCCRVIRSAPKTYLVEGTDGEIVTQMLDGIRTRGIVLAWKSAATESHIDSQHEIVFNFSIDLDLMCRAMAKIALNFLCFRLGHQAAVSRALDGLREYARHGTGEGFEYVTPALLAGQLRDSVPFATSHQHALMLSTDEQGALHATIDLYGKPIGVVCLAPRTSELECVPCDTWLVTRFDSIAKSYNNLKLPHDLGSAIVNPQALGMTLETVQNLGHSIAMAWNRELE